MTQFYGPLTNRILLPAAQRPLAQQIGVRFTSLGGADDTVGDKVVCERLLAGERRRRGGLDGALVSLRTKPRLISSMRLHIKDRDCARRPRQVRRFAWR